MELAAEQAAKEAVLEIQIRLGRSIKANWTKSPSMTCSKRQTTRSRSYSNKQASLNFTDISSPYVSASFPTRYLASAPGASKATC